jgi:DNA repair protein RecN (Recombination protein N)
MLIGLTIKDVVLIQALDLEVGPGLTVLTGETGAGKSIMLDALGLALGRRADAGLVRQGAAQALAAASFSPDPDHPVWPFLEERGFAAHAAEPLVLRRQVSVDGRSRAFINDQPASVTVMRDVGAMLIEIHGQHETVGLLDPRNHRPLLDVYAEAGPAVQAVGEAWRAFTTARDRAIALNDRAAEAARDSEELAARLAELDRLDPRDGEDAAPRRS